MSGSDVPQQSIFGNDFSPRQMNAVVQFLCKKGKRKVQGVPQSQTAALP